MSARPGKTDPALSVERLIKKKDELQEWFRHVKLCCQKEDTLLDQYLQTLSIEEVPQPPPNFNSERTELNQLRVAVQVLQDLSPDEEKDLEVFEALWNCVLPWFARCSVGSDAEAMLDAFMSRLCSLLSAPRIADVVQTYFDRLINLPYPDALIELCRNPTFARKVHSELVNRFVEGVKSLDSNAEGVAPPVGSKAKWRCVRLGALIVDVLQATKVVDDDPFNKELLDRMAGTHVREEEQLTIAFFRQRALKLLERQIVPATEAEKPPEA